MAKKKHAPKTRLKHPAVDDTWKQSFQQSTFRTSFNLSLSQPMIEMLCAIADDVQWDRRQEMTIHRPDNWLATNAALVKRGLARRKTDEERAKLRKSKTYIEELYGEVSYYTLTPAGEAVVQLFKVTGVFIEADNAITKRFRKA